MKQITFLFLLISSFIFGQNQIIGEVRDSISNKPLAFASVIYNNKVQITDVTGKFNIDVASKINQITLSYFGYHSKTLLLDIKNVIIYLNPKSILFNNPSSKKSLDLIKKIITNKTLNNPEKKLKSFTFKSYNKTVITAIPDSIDGSIDLIYNKKTKSQVIDSSDFKFKKLISKQHLFLTEKISLFQFQNNKLKETVLATKMSGFKEPIYDIIGFNLQSYSLYDSKYELFETKYISPISINGLLSYNYKILDTLMVDNKKSAVVYFKNKLKKNSSGLEGVLFIDLNNYAVSKAIIRIKGIIDITAFHEFTFIEKSNIWMPLSNEFKIVKGKNDDAIKIFGDTILFDGEYQEPGNSRKKDASDFSYLHSKTTYLDIELNQNLIVNKRLGVSIDINKDASTKSESFWNINRKDSLDLRSKNTYFALENIVTKRKLESKIIFGKKIINGFIPLKFFDIDLRNIISYNNYEGFRLGFGGITNDKFSKHIRLDGHTAYGIKDGVFKYHLGTAFKIDNFSSSWFGVAFTDDVREIGSTKFNIDKSVYKIYDPRPINVSTFYNHKTSKAYVETKLIPKTESIWQLSQSKIEPKFNYVYLLDNTFYSRYTLTTASVSLQWNPMSSFMQTPNDKIEIEKKYPKLTFQYTQSLPNFLNNDFTFSKFDFKADYEKKYINGQKTIILAQAGFIFGNLPLTHVYNNSPNNLDKEHLIQRVTFAGKNSFETMRFNEFFSSRLIMFHLKHGFKRVKIINGVKPSLVLVTRMTWGDMQKPEQHVGLNYKTLTKGFFESGIELNQIYKGLGLAGFYRYGPNQLTKFQDNIAIKLSFVLDLGL